MEAQKMVSQDAKAPKETFVGSLSPNKKDDSDKPAYLENQFWNIGADAKTGDDVDALIADMV